MWLIYLITTITNIWTPCAIIAGVSGVVLLFITICYYIESSETCPKDSTIKTLKRVKRKLTILFSIFLPLAILIPNGKQLATIVAVGSTLEYVQNNEKIKELPDKAIQCLDKFIDEYLTEEKQ